MQLAAILSLLTNHRRKSILVVTMVSLKVSMLAILLQTDIHTAMQVTRIPIQHYDISEHGKCIKNIRCVAKSTRAQI